jgi:hypothetical protein
VKRWHEAADFRDMARRRDTDDVGWSEIPRLLLLGVLLVCLIGVGLAAFLTLGPLVEAVKP